MNTKKEIMSKIMLILTTYIQFLDKDQHQVNKEIISFLAEKAIIDYQESLKNFKMDKVHSIQTEQI
jgi:hypothetical protein